MMVPNSSPIQIQQNTTPLAPKNYSSKKILFSLFLISIIFIVCISLFLISYFISPLKISEISFYDGTSKELKTKIRVTNPEENFRYIRGIRNKKDIPDGTGVIFKFSSATNSPYWMKDMLFPIDIIWVDNNKIVDYAENLKVPFPNQPPESLRFYKPAVPASSAIEVKAGFIREFGLSKGDEIKEEALK